MATPSSSLSIGSLMRRPEAGAFLGMVAVYLFFAYFGGWNFMSAGGVASWLSVASEIGIIALPVGLLMIAGELDISIGSVMPAGGMTVAVISGYFGLPLIIGVAAGLGLGLLIGFINGMLVLRTKVPSLIVTLGSLFFVGGITLGFTNLIAGLTNVPISADPIGRALLGQFVGESFGLGNIFSVTIFWWALFIAVVGFFMHISPYGNWIYAMGGDKLSARNAGIPTEKLTIGMFMYSSFSAAFLGISQAINYHQAVISTGRSFIFNSIISVVIGGVVLTGGFGSVWGIVFGTITFAMVTIGTGFTGFDANWADAIIGTLLLSAVIMNNNFREWALTFRAKKN